MRGFRRMPPHKPFGFVWGHALFMSSSPAWTPASRPGRVAKGQVGASIFENTKGYDDLQDADDDKNAQLPGLDVVDDTTLKVTLKEPNSAFTYKLGDIAFPPAPSEALKDPKAYGLKLSTS